MTEFWLAFFKEDWGTKAAIFVLVVTLPALAGALFRRKAPGAKILILMVSVQSAQLGPLSDDKPTLLIGGLAALVVGTREAIQRWGKVANP
jgi:hypothetical protein